MSIINNGLLLASEAAAAGGYQVSRSLRFNSADSAYLNRTPASAGNRRTWTFSCWIKRSALGTFQSLFACIASDASHYTQFIFGTDDSFALYDSLCSGGLALSTTQVFRDTSAWFHFLLYYDTTQSTASAKAKLYINGAEVTQFNTDNRSGLTADSSINRADQHVIGSRLPFTGGVGAAYFPGYLADIHFIDGQALTPSSFAETDATTGQWVPKAYGGSYGTNGFRLTFSDNSGTTSTTLGKDAAGSNNWTPNNFSVASGSGNDSLVDSPTSYGTDTGAGGEVRGNYATLNPLRIQSTATLSNGNLDLACETTNFGLALGTIGINSGKWYWEITCNSISGTGSNIGIADQLIALTTYPGGTATSYGYNANGNKFNNGGSSAYGASYTNADVIGVALNLDAGTLVFYKNGSSQGTAYSSLSGTFFPAVSAGGGNSTFSANFGQRPFAYTAPSGFKALCDTSLTAPTIAKPNTVMDVVLYTGTGSSLTPTSTLGFNPDLIWIKSRSAATDHALYDAVRGAQTRLESNTTDAEVTSDGGVTAFNSAGFTVGTLAQVNTSSATYAAWAWDAGTSTVTNNSGSISSQVRANASAGFSIVSWTAPNPPGSITSVGHGLNAAPQFMIFKNRDLNNHWTVYHSSFSNLVRNYLKFSTESVFTRGADLWGTINSSVFSVDQGFLANANEKCIAYCFAPVAGYSAFGSYTGNGSSDGPFVYTGFRSRWILIKSATETAGWMIYDTARDTYNQSITLLYPNLSLAEQSSSNYAYDIVSNGFKVRNSGQNNTSSQTYIYAAFAENPFQYARAR